MLTYAFNYFISLEIGRHAFIPEGENLLNLFHPVRGDSVTHKGLILRVTINDLSVTILIILSSFYLFTR